MSNIFPSGRRISRRKSPFWDKNGQSGRKKQFFFTNGRINGLKSGAFCGIIEIIPPAAETFSAALRI